jgi:hypothetical protein
LDSYGQIEKESQHKLHSLETIGKETETTLARQFKHFTPNSKREAHRSVQRTENGKTTGRQKTLEISARTNQKLEKAKNITKNPNPIPDQILTQTTQSTERIQERTDRRTRKGRRKPPDKAKIRKQIEARIKREQRSRNIGKAARHIRRKGLKDPVLQAVATDQHGNTYDCNSQETMVRAMAKSNSERQQQCVQTPFQMAPLLDVFGFLMDNDEKAQQVMMNGTFIPPEGTDSVAVELLETLKMEESI